MSGGTTVGGTYAPDREHIIGDHLSTRETRGDAQGADAIVRAVHLTSLHELAQLSARATDSAQALFAGSQNKTLALGDIARRTIPRWHFAMLNDQERNDAFAVALERLLRPGSHVLDIGSGTGLLAMMAIRAGAERVTTCEANPLMAEIATQVIDAHGMSDVIDVLPVHSTDLRVGRELPRRADLIISEIVDCGLIGEGLLPTMRHARRDLLAPGGMLLPEGGRIVGHLVESEALVRLNHVNFAGGFDIRLLNSVSTIGHFPVRLSTWPYRALSPSVELVHFDLATDPLEDGARHVVLPTQECGRADGIVAWFELNLGADLVIRNSPDNLASHWMQAFLPFREPLVVQGHDRLGVELAWQEGRLFATPLTVAEGVN